MRYLVVEAEDFTALSAIVADLHTHPSVQKIHVVDEDRVDNLRIFALGEDAMHSKDQNHSTL
jgi:predicted secreted protein